MQRHTRYAEQIYVLEGEFTVWAGGHQAVLRPGDDIVIPAGTPHAVHGALLSLQGTPQQIFLAATLPALCAATAAVMRKEAS